MIVSIRSHKRSSLANMIIHVLSKRNAVNMDALSRQTSLDTGAIEHELELLIERGEVERLRPLGYRTDARDFYRLLRRGMEENC